MGRGLGPFQREVLQRTPSRKTARSWSSNKTNT
jgi:hypothetical protein